MFWWSRKQEGRAPWQHFCYTTEREACWCMSAGMQASGMMGKVRSHEGNSICQRRVQCGGKGDSWGPKAKVVRAWKWTNTILPRQSPLWDEWPMVTCWLLGKKLWPLHTELKDYGFSDQKTNRPLKYFDSCFLFKVPCAISTWVQIEKGEI